MIKFWLCIGFLGQALFSTRFLCQWIASERQKKSVIPLSFWFLSILGSLLLLIYAIKIKDPVFILGQSMGCIVYLRNLRLIYKKESKQKEYSKNS